MPIIPTDWTGQETVNAIGSNGGGGFPVYANAKSIEITITNLDTFIDLIGFCPESINREVSLNLVSGSAQLFFINGNGSYELITKEYLTFNTTNNFVDATLGRLGLSIKCNEITEIFLVVRWDKDIAFNLYSGEDLMINPKVRLLLPTGANYPSGENSGAYDAGALLYESNLQKLKDSDSGVDGFKLFDIFVFYPGKTITFDVVVLDPSNSNYGNIAFQLFDPVDVGQAVFDVANDIINLENRNVSNDFVGNLTRHALYKDVVSNQVILYPDFSRHVGRVVAQDINNSNYYDTAIIESYTPNTDSSKGGTFTLTGQF